MAENKGLTLEDLKKEIENTIISYHVTNFWFLGINKDEEFYYKLITEVKSHFPLVKRVYCFTDPKYKDAHKRPNWMSYSNYDDFLCIDYFLLHYSNLVKEDCAAIMEGGIEVFLSDDKSGGTWKAINNIAQNMALKLMY